MRAIRLAVYELLRFRTPLQRAGLAFLASVPLLYGAIYLWSNWDPYGKIDQVPVAVVNQDRPVTVQGRTIDAGGSFVAELKKDPLVKWQFTDAAEAADGLHDGRYYAIISVPADFSAKLTSGAALGTASPQRAAMQIRLDDANNFLVGIMADTIKSELERRIAAAAVTAYFEAVFGKLDELNNGLAKAADGAGQLRDGLGQANEGSGRLVAGLGKLKDGTQELAPGAAQVSEGVHQLAALGVPLANRAAADLPALARLAVRASTDAEALTALAAEVAGVIAQYAQDANAWLHSIADRHPEVARTSVYKSAVRAVRRLDGRIEERIGALVGRFPELKREPGYRLALAAAKKADATLVSRLRALARRYPALANDDLFKDILRLADRIAGDTRDIAELADCFHGRAVEVNMAVLRFQREVPTLQRKLRDAAAGLTKLDNGARQVSDGAQALDTGVGTALEGAQALHAGNAKLEKGAGDLASGLVDARKQVPQLSDDEQKQAAKTLASPVAVATSNAHPAGEYGRGLAPFFFSIALWVFGIVAFLLLRPVSGRILSSGAGAITTAFAAWLPVLFMGVLGAVLLFTVVDVFLGLDPVNLAGTLGVMALGIAAFSSIVHLVRLAFGAVGDSVALVLLMVQLVSCGGLYPVETLPQPFRAIHEVVPMTYLVEPLRVTIYGGNPAHTWRSVAALAVFLAAALTLLVLVVWRQQTWTMSRLKPELEL